MYSLSSLVGKSSKKSNHTTDGNHIYSSRWYPCKSRGDIQQPRQWSYRKWFFRCSRWALQNSRRYPSIIFLVLIRNCIFFFFFFSYEWMQVFSSLFLLDPCKEWKSLISLRPWYDIFILCIDLLSLLHSLKGWENKLHKFIL